jgi:phage gpG-like protein
MKCKKTTWDTKQLEAAVQKRKVESISHFGGKVRLTAQRSIKKMGAARKEPTGKRAKAKWLEELRKRTASRPGTPPYTHTGQLRQAIVYAVSQDKSSVVIGPNAADMDQVGGLHEFGGTRFGKTYPARPFMGPALEKIQPELPAFWAASIHN